MLCTIRSWAAGTGMRQARSLCLSDSSVNWRDVGYEQGGNKEVGGMTGECRAWPWGWDLSQGNVGTAQAGSC